MLGLLAMATSASIAGAQTVTFYFGGTLEDAVGPWEANDPFVGFFSFSPEVADADTSVTRGDYPGAVGPTEIGIGGFGFVSTLSPLFDDFIVVENGSIDRYVVGVPQLSGPDPLAVLTRFRIILTDEQGTAFADDALPLVPPDLSQLEVAEFRAEMALGLVSGPLTYLSLTDPTVPAIPEPQTYALLVAGLGLLGFAARRRTS